MRGDRFIGRAALRNLIAFWAAVLAVSVVSVGSAQADTATSGAVNRAGTYNGEIWQTLPKFHIGHIHFIISGGKIFDLRFTAGTMCGSMWAIDSDHAIPEFPLALKPMGSFSYQGTVAGRVLRLSGKISGNRAQGTFFQSFALSAVSCTMGQPAVFTATR
jgi:hypothetical protein